ncbi:MAG TPA: efflux RND transporter periplasmic adaptor subunit [Blastocatellia bacterium]|nr:efflux RND transporter periplasmic adaptor subunit [Blastocatellia bacterium]
MTDNNKTTETGLPGPEKKVRIPDNRKVPLIFIVILLITAGALVLLYFKKTGEEKEKEPDVKVSVKVATAERKAISSTIRAVGTITPREQATVSAKISAPIVEMGIVKNKPVKAGDVIAQLESKDLRAQRSEAAATLSEARYNLTGLSAGTIPQGNAQAEKDLRDAQANVNNAKATLDRRRVLYDRGGISKKDLEASELAYDQAQNSLRLAEQTASLKTKVTNATDRAQAEEKVREAENHLANLEAQLSYATIRAPFTGVITDQFQYKGEFAAAGNKLFNIADMSEVIAKAPFADTVVATLKNGDPVTVVPADLNGEEVTASVTLISRSADPTNRTVEVWATFKNPGSRIRAGSAADVVITNKSVDNAVVIPAAAVTLDASNGNTGTVMVVDDKSVAHATKVTVGITTPDAVQILSGLSGGETVVIEGNYALPDGAKVEVSKEDEDKDKDKDSDKDKDKDKDSGDDKKGEK